MIERGAVDARADRQRLAQDRRSPSRHAPLEKNRVARAGVDAPRSRRRIGARPLGEARRAADRLDRHRLDHERLGAVDEAEARLVRALEGAPHRGGAASATSIVVSEPA